MQPIRSAASKPGPAALSEAALVAAARSHDEAAARELIRRLNPRLFRVARGMVDSDAEAEDLVQDAYLAAFAHLDQFGGTASFATWITRILMNAALMRRRRARPFAPYDTVAEEPLAEAQIIDFPRDGQEPAETAFARREVRSFLEDAVACLPADLRLVFLMHETEGMGILAIARDLSLNAVTVRTRLFRARRHLRRTLDRRIRGGFAALFPFDGARCRHMADRVTARLRIIGLL